MRSSSTYNWFNQEKNQTVRINYNRTSTYNRNLKVSTCPHDIVISSQTSNVHQLSFILAPFLWRKICPRLLLQLLLLNLKIFLYVLPFKVGLISRDIFTFVPSSQKCSKSLFSTFILQLKTLGIIIWPIFLRIGPKLKYFLRLSHLYLYYSFSFVDH